MIGIRLVQATVPLRGLLVESLVPHDIAELLPLQALMQTPMLLRRHRPPMRFAMPHLTLERPALKLVLQTPMVTVIALVVAMLARVVMPMMVVPGHGSLSSETNQRHESGC